MRTDENGVRHPLATDEVTDEGLEHIHHCEECRRRFPRIAAHLDSEGVTE